MRFHTLMSLHAMQLFLSLPEPTILRWPCPARIHCSACPSLPGWCLPCHPQTMLLQDLTRRALLLDSTKLNTWTRVTFSSLREL